MRFLIVSDIHGNIAALRAVVTDAGDVDAVIFLGDAVDYGPCPVECVSWVRERAVVAVRGNHDNAVAHGEDSRCSPAYRQMAEATCVLHRRLLGPEDKTFLGRLPIETYFENDGTRFYAVHAAPTDPMFKYLPEDISDEELAQEVAPVEAEVILLGHTHLPFVRRVGGKRVINPGSVGQPKGGDPRASYALWEDGEAVLRRAAYPVEETVKTLQAQPLPEMVIEDLMRVLGTGRL